MSDEAAHQRLLSAIGAALAQPGPYAEQIAERDEVIFLGSGTSPPIGDAREVLGGAVEEHTGRVAWIEQRSEPPRGGYVPVEIDLRWAADGGLLGHLSPELVRASFDRAALGLGLTARDYDPLVEPWLAPDQPAVSYAGLRRPSWSEAETRLSPAVRERLASLEDDGSPVSWGWPGLATVADNLEAILRDRLRIGARTCRTAHG